MSMRIPFKPGPRYCLECEHSLYPTRPEKEWICQNPKEITVLVTPATPIRRPMFQSNTLCIVKNFDNACKDFTRFRLE